MEKEKVFKLNALLLLKEGDLLGVDSVSDLFAEIIDADNMTCQELTTLLT